VTRSRPSVVRFKLFDDTPPLRYADLILIQRPLLSSRSEIRITRACSGDTTVVRQATELRPASMAQEWMLRVRCGAGPAWRSLRGRLRDLPETEVGQVLKEWLEEAREYVESGDLADDAAGAVNDLRDAGEALLRHFNEHRDASRADSVRRWLEQLEAK